MRLSVGGLWLQRFLPCERLRGHRKASTIVQVGLILGGGIIDLPRLHERIAGKEVGADRIETARAQVVVVPVIVHRRIRETLPAPGGDVLGLLFFGVIVALRLEVFLRLLVVILTVQVLVVARLHVGV